MAVLRLCLIASFLLAAVEAEKDHFCESHSCASREELLELVHKYEKERNELNIDALRLDYMRSKKKGLLEVASGSDGPDPTPPSCNICASQPCYNGGTCNASPYDPYHSFTCTCPYEFGGAYCEKNITCTSKSCGQNANCYVANHQTNCVCELGYSGNPVKGCTKKVVKACGSGDPHYTTFDNLHFDYQGTCPYIFSYPCYNLTNYSNYKVTALNKLLSSNAKVSYVSEIEVEMYSQLIHIDGNTHYVYVNGFRTNVPFYWPSKSSTRVSITYSGNTFYVSNDQLVEVTFVPFNTLCIQVPDVPEFRGNRTLCGLAGNLDGNYQNDVVYSNGTFFSPVHSREPSGNDGFAFNHAEDTWITQQWNYLYTGQEKCAPGETLYNNSDCNAAEAVKTCNPILVAQNQQGVFAQCYVMGNQTIQSMYDDCVYDVCHDPNQKCPVLTNFARMCMQYITGDLGDYRNDPTINCPMNCPPYTEYSPCVSSCPATCSDPTVQDTCNQACVDGCQCKPGYVLDTTNLKQVTCIPVEECGCTDPYGNLHPGGQPWLSNDCTVWSVCLNGTYYSNRTQCSQYGHCGMDANYNMQCVCNNGFRGDGYNCTDINECVEDPDACSQDKGFGNCTNTPGSYNCTCKQYYVGRDCQMYGPKRHCADLYQYYNYHSDGVYSIAPPYAINGNPPYSNISVYCDMTTCGGGWTLLSHDDSMKIMVKKSYAEYIAGFGTPQDKRVWLGLELSHQMTVDVETSLRLDLHDCQGDATHPQDTRCTYESFSIGDSSTRYAVTIPKPCTGSGQDFRGDGWIDWNPQLTGPEFVAYDTDVSCAHGNLSCSVFAQNVGFWYNVPNHCGRANLNGVRFSCSNPPVDSNSNTYLEWAGMPIGDIFMWLRPKSFGTCN